MMKVYLLILFMFFISAGNVTASGAGASSLYSLLSHSSARSAAMSGAAVSLEGGLALMQYNPASLLGISNYSLSASYQKGMVDDHHAMALFGMKLENSAIAGGFKYYDTGEVSIYDLYGYKQTKIGQRDTIFLLGGAQDFNFIHAGLGLKVFFSEIFGETAFGFAGDLGGSYRISENVNTGVSVRNIGTPVKYIDKEESLPLIISGGISYKGNLENMDYLLSLDFPYYPNERNVFLNSGVEVMLHDLLTFRAGAQLALGSENQRDGDFSLGWSFGTDNIRLNYAVKITDDLDAPQFLTTEYNF